MSLLPCRHQIVHLFASSSIRCPSRSFALFTAARKTPPPDFILDREPARAAREAAEQASRRKNVGPFPMGQPAQDAPPRRPWQDLGGGERIGRSVTNSSNALVVIFGITISGLVIYAVSSELFASNSPTKIFDQCTEILKKDKETQSLLNEPIRYHAETSGGRRNRRVLSTLSVDSATGREKMTVSFAVEGKAPNGPSDETYWHRFKRWIRPIVVEPSDATALIPTPPTRETVEKPQDDNTGSWLGSVFGSLLPSTYSSKSPTSHTPPVTRMRTKPPKGYFNHGEAIAVLLLNDKGTFELQSLTVYYPHARDWEWKTDVRGAARATVSQEPGVEQAPNRYRFWHR